MSVMYVTCVVRKAGRQLNGKYAAQFIPRTCSSMLVQGQEHLIGFHEAIGTDVSLQPSAFNVTISQLHYMWP